MLEEMDGEATDNEQSLQYEKGLHTFSILFTRWMDSNDWSHPIMVSLAKGAMGGTGWLHSSQISGLRHAKLRSPGLKAPTSTPKPYRSWKTASPPSSAGGSRSSAASGSPLMNGFSASTSRAMTLKPVQKIGGD